MKLWLNGRLLDTQAARIDPRDRGFLLSDGIFDTLLTIDGQPIDLDQHLHRLRNSAERLSYALPFSARQLAAACTDVLDANALIKGRASLRITLSRGPGPRGLAPPDTSEPTCLVTGAQAPAAKSSTTLATSSVRRNEQSPAAHHKTLAYMDNILALAEAQKKDAEDALMLNTAGRVACTSAANIWVLKEDRLTTPSQSEGALPGITRARLLNIAAELGITVAEQPVTWQETQQADVIFTSNSLNGIVPVTALDDRRFASSEMPARLQDAYTASTGFK